VLVVSAVSGQGVADVLRALLRVIEQDRAEAAKGEVAPSAWHP
jgi:hypothetical protein